MRAPSLVHTTRSVFYLLTLFEETGIYEYGTNHRQVVWILRSWHRASPVACPYPLIATRGEMFIRVPPSLTQTLSA
jgi:hypothetical protein